MSDSDTISLFNNVISAVLSMIGTFALLILFGCVFKTRNARIDKTPEIHQESIIFHKDKDAEALIERKTQSTQQDDFKDSRPNSKIHILDMLRRRRRSEMSKRYKHNTAEEIHEGFIRTQTREEEPSTLEGVASITRDDAPSVINQLRIASIKMNLIPKKHYSNKGDHILHHTKRKSFKKT
ncbi:Golgin subfamily A member [Dirofilaria immitis]